MYSYLKRLTSAFAGIILFLFISIGSTVSVLAQTTKTVGTGGNYSTLSAAFQAIYNGQLTGDITLKIISNITEPASTSLYKSGTGSSNYTSILIYPAASNLVISGARIYLYEVANLTINGSLNGAVSNRDLTMQHITSLNISVFNMQSAKNIVLKNLILKNKGRNGIVRMSYYTGSTQGCENNLIDNCLFTGGGGGRSSECLLSIGNGAYKNKNNTVQNCHFIDFLDGSVTSGYVIAAIALQSNNTNWTIDNNSFYETGGSAIDFLNNTSTRVIQIQASGPTDFFTVTNNKIGGSDASCGGSPMIATGTPAAVTYHRFSGIETYQGSYVISNNIIRNIEWSTTDMFIGIYIYYSGNYTVTGNQIGSVAANSSIKITSKQSLQAYGIASIADLAGYTHTVENNSIGGIDMYYSGATNHMFSFDGIKADYFTTCNNNIVGSSGITNSITTPATVGSHSLNGIRDQSNGVSPVFSGNIIANLTNQSSSSGAMLTGIKSMTGTSTIENNQVYNLTSKASNNSIGFFSGIKLESNTKYAHQIVGNEVYNLSFNSGYGSIAGIYLYSSASGSSNASRNKVYGITSNSASDVLYGLYQLDGSWNMDNNMVSLGSEASVGCSIAGVWLNTGATNMYYNSIQVAGTIDASASTASTYALNSTVQSVRTYKNNLFINNRQGGTTGLHYALGIQTYTQTLDYNDYYSASGNLGSYGGVLKTSVADWRLATGQDSHSVSENVSFTSATNLHLNGTLAGDGLIVGTPLVNYTTDFDGTTRSATTPKMGYHELQLNEWTGNTSSSWNTASNWSLSATPVSAATVIIPDGTSYQPEIGNSVGASCNHLFVNSGATLTIKSGGSLITNGTITNNGTITMERSISESVWHLVASPLATATANTFLGDYLQSWSESTSEWTDIVEPETELTAGLGYGLYGKPGKSPSSNHTYTFTGTPNTGNVEQSISYTPVADIDYDGANLLGNPYPSAIDWNQVSGFGSVYYWDGSAYVSYPQTGGFGTGSRYIPPMQGFFIVVPDNDPNSFTFTNAMRTHTGATNYYKSSHSLSDGLMLSASNGQYKDKLLIRQNEEASENFDFERDAWKLPANTSGLSQLWSVCADGRLSIDVRPATDVIQLGFANDQAGTYSISLDDMAGIGNAILEDTRENTFTDLSKGAYSFIWQPTDNELRFRLHTGALAVTEKVTNETRIYSYRNTLYVQMQNREQGDIFIYNLAGQLIATREQTTDQVTIDLSSTGVYMVKVVTGRETVTRKVWIR